MNFLQRAFLGFAFVCIAISTTIADDQIQLGALIDTDRISETLIVDPRSPNASDYAEGTEQAPFRSVQAALNRAKALVLMGKGVRISLAPVTFTESLRLEFHEDAADNLPPITLEAMEPGETIFSGADPVDFDWDIQGAAFVADWPYAMEPMINGDESSAGRRELLFIENVRLVQVMRKSDVQSGTYYIDQEAKRIHMLTPQGGVALRDTFYVGVPERQQLLRAVNVPNLLLQGIVFKQSASGIGQEATVFIQGGKNTYINGCQFDYNNGTALTIRGADYATVFGSSFKRNGWSACEVRANESIQFGAQVAELNAWRILEAGKQFLGATVDLWAGNQATAYRNRIMNNYRAGLRADAYKAVAIDKGFVAGNSGYGVFASCRNGVVKVSGVEIVRNNKSGLVLRGRAMAEYCTIVGNGSDVPETSAQLERPLADSDLILENNVLYSENENVPAIRIGKAAFAQAGLRNYSGERNLFYGMKENQLVKIGPVALSLDEWRMLTQTDKTSRYSNPRFADLKAMDYALRPNSPIYERANWQPQEPEVQLEAVLEKLRHDN